jgi:glucokinase
VGGSKIEAGVVDSMGGVKGTNRVPAREGCSLDELLSDLQRATEPLHRSHLSGIAAGFPALGDFAAGVLHGDRSLFPCVEGIAMRDYLSNRYGMPCRMTTDAGLFTYGVWRFGEGRGLANFIALALGTGIGIGVVQDGRIDHGSRGVPDAALELFAVPEWQPAAGHHFPRLYGADAKAMAERARAGDEQALQAYEATRRALAYVLKELMSLYTTGAVIVGGGMSAAWELFWPALSGALGARSQLVRRTELRYPALSGGAALFL